MSDTAKFYAEFYDARGRLAHHGEYATMAAIAADDEGYRMAIWPMNEATKAALATVRPGWTLSEYQSLRENIAN